MSNAVKSFEFSPTGTTPEELVDIYLSDTLSETEQGKSKWIATNFEKRNKLISRTIVLIPVAAHQDGKYIHTAIEQYSKQTGAEPFTICIYLNSPFDPSLSDQIEEASKELMKVEQAFPNLDLRVIYDGYEEPKIGKIRRNLWNGALLLAYNEGLFQNGGNVIGINNDIDTAKISPHYISRIQKYYANHRSQDTRTRSAITRVSHERLKTHPNVAKVTTWIDNTVFQSPYSTGYEAGVTMEMSHYTLNGGFDPGAILHETQKFTSLRTGFIAGAQIQTSPRRYIDRLRTVGTDQIWTPESFSFNDACRDDLGPDITPDRAEEILRQELEQEVLSGWVLRAIHKSTDHILRSSPQEAIDPVFRKTMLEQALHDAGTQHRKAERFMRLVVGLDILADVIHNIDVEDFVTNRIETALIIRANSTRG